MFCVDGSSSDDAPAAAVDVEMTVLDDIQTDGSDGSERDDATINSGRAGTATADEWTAAVADEGDSNRCVADLSFTTFYVHVWHLSD